jgi:hypothetical protein
MCQDAVLTRDKYEQKAMAWMPICSFCNHVETNDHLFFNCPIFIVVLGVLGKALGSNLITGSFWQAMAWFHSLFSRCGKFHVVILASIYWAIWNMRNRVTFDKIHLKSPSVITFYAISLLIYWAGLQKVPTDKGKLLEGAHKLKQVAAMVYSRQDKNGGDSHQLAIVALT